MLIDKYKRGVLNIEDIYFSNDTIKSNADIIRYFQSNNKYTKSSKEFSTNIIDLTLNFDEIKQGFSKSTKGHINQASKKYHILTDFFYNPDINIINEFCLFYDKVANIKKLPIANKNKLKRLKESILISKAFNDENILVWHLYIFDKSRIRLLYSCSMQTNDEELQKVIPRANKLLHSEDIKFSKEKGFKIFDFGGISLVDDKVAGIDQFKLGFSKEIEKSYNFIIGNTFIGKVVVFLYNLKGRIF